jgi:hypothetical protein
VLLGEEEDPEFPGIASKLRPSAHKAHHHAPTLPGDSDGLSPDVPVATHVIEKRLERIVGREAGEPFPLHRGSHLEWSLELRVERAGRTGKKKEKG